MPRVTLKLATAVCVMASLTACHPKSLADAKDDMVKGGVHVSTSEVIDAPVTVGGKLDCPETQGELKRTAQAADGLSCSYQSDKGLVDLSLVSAGDDAKAALAPIKAKLDAMLPDQARGGTINVVSEKGPDGREKANVDMPFLHVRDDGERSHVKILGFTIDADKDEKDRKPAKAISAGPHGRELVYVLAGDGKHTGGYDAVGYVARGADTGPLVVGVFKYAKGGEWSHGDNRHDNDLDALISLNAPKGHGGDNDEDKDTGRDNKTSGDDN